MVYNGLSIVKRSDNLPQLILFIIVGLGFGLFLLLNKTFNRSKKQIILKSKDLLGVDYSFFRQDTDWLEKIEKSELTIESYDGLNLYASLISQTTSSNLCIILCHGYSSNRTSMAVFAKYYYEHYHAHICMIDARAHGTSEGNTIGFGYHDRNDLHQWINLLKLQYGKNIRFILHGISMGASTLLYASIGGFDPTVKGIITDSAFIDLRPVFIRQMKQIYHLPAFPFIHFIDFAMKYVYKIPFDKTNLLNQKDKLTTPCLIIHGKSDRFVPYEMAETLNSIYPVYHQFLAVENANHALAFSINPEIYKVEIEKFLKYCLNQ
jgi:uncharacterized protein